MDYKNFKKLEDKIDSIQQDVNALVFIVPFFSVVVVVAICWVISSYR